MKYLVYARPSKNFCDKLLDYRDTISDQIIGVSSNVLHCTLMMGKFEEKNEQIIVEKLSEIRISPFKFGMSNLEIFEGLENRILVGRIKKSEELNKLHYEIINKLKQFVKIKEPSLEENILYLQDEERRRVFEEYGTPYYEKFYNPHVTIAEVKFGEVKKHIFIEEEIIDGFYLSKKDRIWQTVQRFSLK